MIGLFLIIINSALLYNLILQNLSGSWHYKIRESILIYLLINTALVFITTEVLSIFNLIKSNAFLLEQFFLLIIFIIFSIKKFNYQSVKLSKEIRFIFLSTIITIVIPVFITSFFYAPNNWDSYTCWLARVENWIQNGSINYYPTNFDLQNSHQPLSSFIFLFVRILTNNDYYLNIIQFFFLLGISSGVSLIVSVYNGNKWAQIISFILCLTLSSAILQANVVKNDIIVSFYFIVFLYYLIKIAYVKYSFYSLVFLALGISFSLLTKLTVLPFIIVFVFYFLFKIFREYKIQKILFFILIIGSIFLITNGPYYYRNYSYFNNILGNTVYKEDRSIVDEMRGKSQINIFIRAASVISKYIGWQFSTSFKLINRNNEILIEKFHSKILKIDINETNHGSYKLLVRNYQEDVANNLAYSILFCFSLFLFYKKRALHKGILEILFLCIISFILFVFLFPVWDPGRSRYLLPLFFATIIFSSILISGLKSVYVKATIYLFLLAGFINVSLCTYRPLFNFYYFNNHIKLILETIPNRFSDTALIDSLVATDYNCPITKGYIKENNKWVIKNNNNTTDKKCIFQYLKSQGIISTLKYFDREKSYLANDPQFYAMIDTIKRYNFKKIALFTSPDFLEYSLWVKLNAFKLKYKIRSLTDKSFSDYDCIIVFEKDASNLDWYNSKRLKFGKLTLLKSI